MKEKNHIGRHNDAGKFEVWFETIYDENFERLLRYAFSITKKRALAEDVVSEVFLNIWVNKPDYTNIRELRSYLHVSVKHLAIRLVTKDPQHFAHSIYDETIQISDVVDPESLLLAKELDELVSGVIAGMSDHTQLVYDFSKNKGFTNQQIADELGISKRSVESHLHQVIKKLKEALGIHFKDSDKSYPLMTKLNAISLLGLGTLSPEILNIVQDEVLRNIQ